MQALRICRRVLLALLLTFATMAIATMAMFLTTAPAPLSLLLEPASLLYMPGVVLATLVYHGHDISTQALEGATVIFYVVFWIVVLSLQARRRSRAAVI